MTRSAHSRPEILDVTALSSAASADVAYSALAVEAAPEGVPAEWAHLLPMGRFTARDGRGPWLVENEAHARDIVAASLASAASQDMVVDYDHHTERALEHRDVQAIASGWVKGLEARADGVWGRIDWTAPAARQLRAKQYRYLSPVFGHEKPHADGSPMRVFRLLRAALTNSPALTELAAVAAVQPNPGAPMLDLPKIAAALGLAASASESEVLAACAAAVASRTSVAALASIAAAVGKTGAPAEEVSTAAVAAVTTPDPAKFVPISALSEVQSSLRTLQTSLVEDKAVAAVDAAVEAGKVTPGAKAWALDYAKKDLAGFTTFVGASPVIVSREQTAAAARATTGEPSLTAEEKSVCALMGLTEAQMLKSKKDLAR